MTPQELFDDGRLSASLAALEAAPQLVAEDRLFLVQLLLFAGRFADARTHLALIESDDAAWPTLARNLLALIQAGHRREDGRRPRFFDDPTPRHAMRRWLALKALRTNDPALAVRWIDRADTAVPELGGFLDGQEFDGLLDADELFASVLEAVVGREPAWFPWETLRSVRLAPAKFPRDRLFRPVTIVLCDGRTIAAHVPLTYPGSHAEGDEFALGLATDFRCRDDGPTRCTGSKLLLVGDAEVPLAEVTMIEVRPRR